MAETSAEELTKYFEDILKNKELIIEMVNTNVLMYEEKIKINKEKIQQLKELNEKMNAESTQTENKRKSEYAKYQEQFQKHEINYKLLERTSLHYKSLIKEREEEIRKFEEQAIYCYQDYQNKKVKLDCLNVQMVEAEFQLKNLQKLMDEKINSIVTNKHVDSNTFQNISLESNKNDAAMMNKELVTQKEKEHQVTPDEDIKSAGNAKKKRRTNIFGEEMNDKEEGLLSSFKTNPPAEQINLKKEKNCIIY